MDIDSKVDLEELKTNTSKTQIFIVMAGITVDVYSDLACPWCYVGKRHLDNAINRYLSDNPGISVNVHWHPYIIDKNTAKHGEKYMDYNIRRWGGDGWTHSLRKSGRKLGLEFKDWQIWPNTLHGHRLVHLAGEQKGPAGQNAAKNVLFSMIYEEGRNISEIDTLIEAAHTLQLDGADEYLKSKKDTDVILAEDARAKTSLRISGVPYFIFQDKQRSYTLSGAQPSDNILQTLGHLQQ